MDKGNMAITPQTTGFSITIPRRQIISFCQRWKVIEFALFGSALRSDFSPTSDVDVLVSFDTQAQWSLFDLIDMQAELEQIFQRPVDLVERDGLRNPFRRKAILESARVVYAA
jgi:hypothetical protein